MQSPSETTYNTGVGKPAEPLSTGVYFSYSQYSHSIENGAARERKAEWSNRLSKCPQSHFGTRQCVGITRLRGQITAEAQCVLAPMTVHDEPQPRASGGSGASNRHQRTATQRTTLSAAWAQRRPTRPLVACFLEVDMFQDGLRSETLEVTVTPLLEVGL